MWVPSATPLHRFIDSLEGLRVQRGDTLALRPGVIGIQRQVVQVEASDLCHARLVPLLVKEVLPVLSFLDLQADQHNECNSS